MDGRSLLPLAVLSLCVRSSPALPSPGARPVCESPARPAPRAPRVWPTQYQWPPVGRCAVGLGLGVSGAGLWVLGGPCRVFSSKSLVCMGLASSGFLPLVSAPASVSHKVSAPVRVSFRLFLWYGSTSPTISGPCSSVCVGILLGS